MLDDGKTLLIPLFHGTSSIFENSIISEGLGGINPIQDLKVYDTFCVLFELAEQRNDEWWIANRWTMDNLRAQNVTNGSNWRHGRVYLSPSRETAVRYAGNRFGSEFISQTLLLFEKLRDHTVHFCVHDHPVLSLLSLSPEPIVVEARNIPLSNLRTEKGENSKMQLEEMAKDSNDKLSECLWQQNNFELILPLSSEHLRIEHL